MQSFRCGILAAMTLALAGALFAAQPPGLAETVERFDHLTVGDAVVVNNLHLTAGHVDVGLVGRAAPVRAGEEVVGIFFEGTGTMDYLSVDPIEAPVVLFNASKGIEPEAREDRQGSPAARPVRACALDRPGSAVAGAFGVRGALRSPTPSRSSARSSGG